jgi:hypothetical protein
LSGGLVDGKGLVGCGGNDALETWPAAAVKLKSGKNRLNSSNKSTALENNLVTLT